MTNFPVFFGESKVLLSANTEKKSLIRGKLLGINRIDKFVRSIYELNYQSKVHPIHSLSL